MFDVLLHCAGSEISPSADKPQREYDLVFDVKAHGWLNVLAALGNHTPATAIVFSSIAGRFGNGGQTDYAAANDLLCKSVSSFRRHPGAPRGVAIDWTAWAGIGMASRGSIPKMMATAGIDMLPAGVGVPAVRRELVAAGPGTEVVIAGDLGSLLDERHPTGGLDAESASEALADRAGPMTGLITELTIGGGLRVITDLDPVRQPFLRDHRIEGSRSPGRDGHGGLRGSRAGDAAGMVIVALEDVELLTPFKFYRDEPRSWCCTQGCARRRRNSCRRLRARRQANAARAGRAGDETLPPACGSPRGAVPAARPRGPGEPDSGEESAGVDHDAIYAVCSTAPPIGCSVAPGVTMATCRAAIAPELPATHGRRSARRTLVPRLIELSFPDGRDMGDRHAGRMAIADAACGRVMRYRPTRAAPAPPRQGCGRS